MPLSRLFPFVISIVESPYSLKNHDKSMLLLPILVTMENSILVLVRYKRLLQYSLHLFQIRCI